MIKKQDLQKLRTRYERLEESRLALQKIGSEAQRLAKQSMFAAHRNDMDGAEKLMGDARKRLDEGQRLVTREPRLAAEGMWRSALEEFGEAELFLGLLEGRFISSEKYSDDPSLVLAAMSDAVGELVRRAVHLATKHDQEGVERLHEIAAPLVEFLSSLDLTGNLRSKGDQARQHLRRLEDIRYELALRHGSVDA